VKSQVKKNIAAFLLLLAICSLAGCEKKKTAPEELAGKWVLTGARHDGVEYTVEELQEFGINITRSINFIDDVNVVLAVGVRDDSLLGATPYTFDGSTVTIPAADMTLTLDGSLLLYQTGQITQLFEREEIPAEEEG